MRPFLGKRARDIRLFGSFARGEAHEDSDIDVLILVDDMTDADFRMILDASTSVILSTGLPLAVLPMSTERLERLREEERALARSIDEEGISL